MSKKYDYEFFIDGAVFINTEKGSEFDMETACDILNDQADKIADLEAKLAESENKAYVLQTKLNMKEYAPVFCRLAGRECEELGTIDQLKQQLAEKDAEVQSWKDGTMVVKLGKLEEQLAEERKKVVQEIRSESYSLKNTPIYDEYGGIIGTFNKLDYGKLEKILDQIERGE